MMASYQVLNSSEMLRYSINLNLSSEALQYAIIRLFYRGIPDGLKAIGVLAHGNTNSEPLDYGATVANPASSKSLASIKN
jgi:hypothetical protein